ncbi:type I-E CRISPR-associated protein Cse1/CasA [Roseiflexus sp.]|uniref:type I-E CRISPR-associated protein Cse1/CasA n=1 Tax=Roseiflexus sp. TaxID=2562120 RepID=UPI00398B11EB
MEKWIRVFGQDQVELELSMYDCLKHAHTLVGLSDPSPLVLGSTHRLLAAILQAIYDPQDVADIEQLLRAGQFDATRIQQFGRQYAARFELFDPEAPFLQTGDVPLDGRQTLARQRAWSDPQPVARLFAEVPVATERTHFTHVTDESHRFCPACCARGLVTVPAFASSGGAGMRPSINGVPPMYVLPAGDTLFEALTLSLMSKGFQPRVADSARCNAAIWTSDPPVVQKQYEVSAVGYIESLTFPARRMRLYPQTGQTVCTQCGRNTAVFVSAMLFEMGHWLTKKIELWDDPFVAFRSLKQHELRPVRPEQGKAVWREYTTLLLKETSSERPKVVEQVARLIDRGVLAERQLVRFRCIGLRTDNKAKIFEWLDEALEAPPALLTDLDAASYIDMALQQSNEGARILQITFDRHFRPERAQSGAVRNSLVRFKSVCQRMIADYWQQLGLRFRSFINDVSHPKRRDTVQNQWAKTVVEVAQQCFDRALEQTGNHADALRIRVEAKSDCNRGLYAKRKEWLHE